MQLKAALLLKSGTAAEHSRPLVQNEDGAKSA
jgi:hypothetical protein